MFWSLFLRSSLESYIIVGWGGVGGIWIILHVSLTTQPDLHLHFLLRNLIFTCTWYYANVVAMLLALAI